jgi:flagellin-like protein
MEKKGVTPVISTVLLIMIVIVIAIIILLWYMNFKGESVMKFDKPIDDVCSEVYIEPYVNADGTLGYKNTGNIPIYEIDLQTTDSFGNTKTERISSSNGGRTAIGSSTIFKQGSTEKKINNTEEGSKVTMIPILYGETESGLLKEYTCPNAYEVKIYG